MKNSATKSKAASCQPKFIEGEKILCYHGTYIYEAKVKMPSHYFFLIHQLILSASNLKKFDQMNTNTLFITMAGIKSTGKIFISIFKFFYLVGTNGFQPNEF